jgi:hypothetical protein
LDSLRKEKPGLALAGAAAFALAWLAARAALQSITIDEADTYLVWAAAFPPVQWMGHANNHVLNSMLMRLSTTLLGVSQFSVRVPALLGAAVYLLAGCWLARALLRERWLRLAFFVCLVFNPFVQDHLVAARGYSLAAAFLLLALAIPVAHENAWRAAATSSLCLALSFAANFSFAFVDAAALVALFLWLGRKPRLLAPLVLPGLAVTVFLSASPLLTWSPNELVYGARSLRETAGSVIEASLFELNPEIVSPFLVPALSWAAQLLLPFLAAAALAAAIAAFRDRRLWLEERTRRIAGFGLGALGIAALALGVHTLAYHLFGLLLPKDRTALYLVPLATLAAGALVSLPALSRFARWSRRALSAALLALACYFLLCLRLTYFKEWAWDADVRPAYDALAYYHHAYGVTDVVSNWRYSSALEFYRRASGREAFPDFRFVSVSQAPPGRQAYVLDASSEWGVVVRERLQVVYRGDRSQIVVAIRPTGARK